VREVMVYSQPGCPPCEQFHIDAQAGKFPGYIFKPGDPLFSVIESTPAFAYRGQLKYGYDGPADLLTWLAAVERAPADPPIAVPDPQPTPAPGVTPLRRTTEEIADIKFQVEKLIADVREFQSAGVIGKLRRVDDLKADVEALKESTSGTRSEIAAIRDDYRNATEEHPWYYGLGAAVLGVIKRRFLNRGPVVAEV
jgi:hypothetical protein